jgi:hypothetical protein
VIFRLALQEGLERPPVKESPAAVCIAVRASWAAGLPFPRSIGLGIAFFPPASHW